MPLQWEDERYVRLYTRDTPTWVRLPWQSRFVLMSLLRKLDRKGRLDLGEEGDAALESLAGYLMMPLEVVAAGLPPLLRRGVFAQEGPILLMPNFIKAQEARLSDRARQALKRERERVNSDFVTHRDTESRTVTESHELSRDSEVRHEMSLQPSLALPSLAQPSLSTGATKAGVSGDPAAIRVLELLNAARKRVIKDARSLRPTPTNLKHIAARLAEGHTLEECEHVIAVREAEVRRKPDSADWFDAVTPFRPDNFGRTLGRTPQAPPVATATRPAEQDLTRLLRRPDEEDPNA